MSVSTAVKVGRLKASVVRDVFGQPKIGDPDLADREWDSNTDSQRRINAAGGIDPTALPQFPEDGMTSTERLKSAQADLAELKYKEAAGELVPVEDVDRRLVAVFSQCKTRLLAIPSRTRQALPHLSAADVTTIRDLIREALEELAVSDGAE